MFKLAAQRGIRSFSTSRSILQQAAQSPVSPVIKPKRKVGAFRGG